MTPLPSLIESGIAEFDGRFWLHRIPKNTKQSKDVHDFIASLATKVHNAAIESALEALPNKNAHELHSDDRTWCSYCGRNEAIREARAKLSALKKENV